MEQTAMTSPRSVIRWLLLPVIAVTLLAVPSQAWSDSWTSDHCATAGWSAPNAIVCVKGYMGGKDIATKRQWIGQVRVFTKCGSCTSAGTKMLEAWGDGFYKSISYSTSSSRYIDREVTWTINRWLRSGTNVCGARTFFTLYPRAIACFTIKV
jgi:hypothetical protein